MNNPDEFQLTSDFATLKNDATGIVSVTFPGSVTIAANSTRSYNADIPLGSRGAMIRSRIYSSKDGNIRYSGSSLSYRRTGSLGTYSVFAIITRLNATTIRVMAFAGNPYGNTMTTEAGSETFTFEISTFLPPFP